METIRTIYQGELRTESTLVKSGMKVITDVPDEHGGKGEGFSPSDLFCVSLVSSMLSVMGGLVRNPSFGGTIDGMIVRTTKKMKEKPHRVEEIIIDFDLPKNNFTDEQKKLLEAAALNSQVGRSIHDDLIQTLKFNY